MLVSLVGMVSNVGWQTAMGASTKKEKTHFSGRFSTVLRKILFSVEVSLVGFVFFWFFTESWGMGIEGEHPSLGPLWLFGLFGPMGPLGLLKTVETMEGVRGS